MSRKTLHQLYAEHTGKVSDKWSLYLTEYDRLFNDYRDKPIRLLEIGIQNGGSLEIWSKYFSNAVALIGCDINPDCARLSYDDPHIGCVIGDANAAEVCDQVLQRSPQFDIIIDDGSHRSNDIIKSFALYFPRVAEGGVFIVEDLHCSYWSQFKGGLFDPFSSISFFKHLVDVISHEHWGIAKARAAILLGIFSKYGCEIDEETLSQVHSVEFINSMCVVRKASLVDNGLGHQVIAGSLEEVVQGRLSLNNLPFHMEPLFDQSNNPWTVRSLPPEEIVESLERDLNGALQQISSFSQSVCDKDVHIRNLGAQIVYLKQTVVERDEQVAQLNQAVHDKDVHIRNLSQIFLDRSTVIQELYASSSWRITAPIRRIAMVFIRNKTRMQVVGSLLPAYIDSCGGFFPAAIKVVKVLKRDGWNGLIKRVLILKARSGAPVENSQHVVSSYANYIATMEPKAEDLKAMVKVARDFNYQPKFSIAVPVYNVDAKWLTAFIESVLAQVYSNWELCIADDHSTAPHVRPLLKSFAAKDKRIKLVFRETNGHISAATNSALELATGDFVCLMDNDDEIAPHALFEFASLLNRDSTLDMIYSDEDKLDMAGNRYEPFFKPDWSPEALEGCMYTAHFACYRMSLVRDLGGFRGDFNGAQDYDFVLRFTERATKIAHIPKVLYHWRAIPGSTAASMDAKDYVLDAAVRALTERAERVAGGGEARLGSYSGSFDLRYRINGSPLVSIVIPSAGRMAHVRGKDVDLLSQVVISIHEKTTYRNFEIIIVDNNDLRAETIEAIKPYNCQFVHFEGKFNIATKMNMGAKVARGEYLLFMNDDIEVITPDWMECMLQLCQRKGVGAVGAKLQYENESLQHVGVAFWNGLPDHIHRAFPKNYPGHYFSVVANRNYLAVTGAVLMTKHELFKSVGGFEEQLAINYNDIDYCLKVFNEGYRIVLAAGSQLCHYESVSREAVVASDEIELFQQKWKDVVSYDPYYGSFFDNHPPVFALRHEWTNLPVFDPLKSPVISHY